MKKYYITTPIYYANAKIHFWNLYTTLIADILARSKRLLWYDVKFSTGTDENWQKMTQVAAQEGKWVQEFLDSIVAQDKKVMKESQITYTDFIRTTSSWHHKLVQSVLQKTYDAWYIYKGIYEWYYCVWCESFKKSTDLIDLEGKLVCPDHLKEPEHIKEENRFFKLSAFEDKLREFYKNHPDFLQPQKRYNEIIAFVEQGLEDFSISRQWSDFWIPLPFDPENVTYIRYDALLNYLSVVTQDYDESWMPIIQTYAQEMHHTLGKDIARFHAIYWPAMLMAAGYWSYIPKKQYIWGFFTVDGQKMSKSLGNTLHMEDLIKQYGRDAVVFYLCYEIPQWSDGDFSLQRLADVQQSMLLSSRGNLVSRVTKLAAKHWITTGKKHFDTITYSLEDFEHSLDNAKLQEFMHKRYRFVQQANTFMQDHQPWVLLKDESTTQEGLTILEHLLREIKQLWLLSAPILIEWFERLQDIFNNTDLILIQSEYNLIEQDAFRELYTQDEFEVDLDPDVLYEKTE